MRYDDLRRLDGVGGLWLRFKLRMTGYPWFRPVILPDVPDLNEYLRRDIGLPDQVQYMDWKALKDQERL
ncbi:hypothetical protein [Microvirga pudoricolor]|uniref:hypothetical protein n=1 Tax=Microvirga pudoricolor TaxID=2778729 RepID=UPI001950C385|nr:hypothetical protein [Microvirga pudoricolor]MBM6595661.1 hypothetical protein [Microvirga pudoricolor]